MWKEQCGTDLRSVGVADSGLTSDLVVVGLEGFAGVEDEHDITESLLEFFVWGDRRHSWIWECLYCVEK